MNSLSGRINNSRDGGDDNYEGSTNHDEDLFVSDAGSSRSHSSSPTPPATDSEPPFSVDGIDVWVEGDWKRLPEYLDPDEDQQEARERHRITRYVEYEPGTIARVPYKIARDFECRVAADGPALQSKFLLDGKVVQRHVDNPKYMRPKDQDFFDEFAGRSLGRAKAGPTKAGRRKVIFVPMMFRPRGYRKSTGNGHKGAYLTTARR